jgi:hypothetical protein
MVAQVSNIAAILDNKLRVCRDLKNCLINIIDHQQGSQWGHEQADTIAKYFEQLKSIDRQMKAIGNFGNDDYQINPVQSAQKKEIDQTLRHIKDLMLIFENRLNGAKSLLYDKLKGTLKAMKIKGYHGGKQPQPSTAFRLY